LPDGTKKKHRESTPKSPPRLPFDTQKHLIGLLIKHYAGNFPLWLAPERVRLLTLNDGGKLVAYPKEIVQQLRAAQVGVESDFSGPKQTQSLAVR
jgi:threonyl-tRNA synthetase